MAILSFVVTLDEVPSPVILLVGLEDVLFEACEGSVVELSEIASVAFTTCTSGETVVVFKPGSCDAPRCTIAALAFFLNSQVENPR